MRQASGLTGLEEAGAIISDIAPEVRSGWAESLATFPGQQAAEAGGRGMPGTKVMQAYLDAVATTDYEWPFDITLGE